MHAFNILAALLMVCLAPAALAKSVEIGVDPSLAVRLVSLACSGKKVDAAEFRNSPVLKDQFAHHAAFGKSYTIDNYIAGVQSIAACRKPESDPFRFAALVTDRDRMTKAVAFLQARKDELGKSAASMILPYVPANVDFRGNVVLAPASFSCGGFASGPSFFIDVPCLAGDIEGEYDAVTKLVAHETYHAAQRRFMPDLPEPSTISAPGEALEFLFGSLAVEGSASFVADAREIRGDAPYAKFSRELARRNFAHLAHDFRLFGYITELLGQSGPDYPSRFKELYSLGFSGAYDQHGYFVGQQMSAEIVADFGQAALPCVLTLPAEQFVLAYERALRTGANLKDSHPLPQSMVTAARGLEAARKRPATLDRCLAGTAS